MTIYKNAIDSIEIGIEDFQSEESRRYISAIRNIYAGILLLCKHKLYTLSPEDDHELLIKKSLVPYVKNGSVIFKGTRNQTVDMQLIEERFKSLGIAIDFGKLKKIQKHRNNIEHYYTTESVNNINESISDSFLLINDFLTNELDITPSKAFDSDCWSFLLNRSEIYKSVKVKCVETIEAIDWQYDSLLELVKEISCPCCGSELIEVPDNIDGEFPDIDLRCNSCSHSFIFSDIFNEEIRDMHDWEDHNPDGVLIYCEECSKKAYLTMERQCILCEHKPQLKCSNCDHDLTSDEADISDLCSACYSD